MLDREVILQAVVASVGALILVVAILFAASSSAGSNGQGAELVVGGIALFILYLTVAGYWLSAR